MKFFLLSGLLVSFMFLMGSCGKKDQASTSDEETQETTPPPSEGGIVSADPAPGSDEETIPEVSSTSSPVASLTVSTCGKRPVNNARLRATYLNCRYQESKMATDSATNRQTVTTQYTCTKDGSSPIQLVLHEYTYTGLKPSPNALVCELQENSKPIGFAHRTSSYCRSNSRPSAADSLKEVLSKHKASGYECNAVESVPPASI